MPRNITEDLDRFAIGIDKLVGDIPMACDEALDKAVSRSTRKAAKSLREELTEKIGKHEWSEEYRKGFTSRVDRSEAQTVGTVGNKNKPGLVHLLEKGHATPAGRRTQAYPHMDVAFVGMQEEFMSNIKKDLREAMR